MPSKEDIEGETRAGKGITGKCLFADGCLGGMDISFGSLPVVLSREAEERGGDQSAGGVFCWEWWLAILSGEECC
jgi:hypothetical protein